MQLDVEWTAERNPDRLEMFWDGVLVYALVNQQNTFNRLESVTGAVHPWNGSFKPQRAKPVNPALHTMFDWLQVQGMPPLPVASAQDLTHYPARNRDGSLKRDKDGDLVPAFTGKNPSYVDSHGIPQLIRHTHYQNRLSTQAELQTWFANPDNGIGSLGSWLNIVWVNMDVKEFESQQACDQRISDWLDQYPLLQQMFTERTHSGGWRLAVRANEKSFTNFSLDGVGGQHMGETLG